MDCSSLGMRWANSRRSPSKWYIPLYSCCLRPWTALYWHGNAHALSWMSCQKKTLGWNQPWAIAHRPVTLSWLSRHLYIYIYICNNNSLLILKTGVRNGCFPEPLVPALHPNPVWVCRAMQIVQVIWLLSVSMTLTLPRHQCHHRLGCYSCSYEDPKFLEPFSIAFERVLLSVPCSHTINDTNSLCISAFQSTKRIISDISLLVATATWSADIEKKTASQSHWIDHPIWTFHSILSTYIKFHVGGIPKLFFMFVFYVESWL